MSRFATFGHSIFGVYEKGVNLQSCAYVAVEPYRKRSRRLILYQVLGGHLFYFEEFWVLLDRLNLVFYE